MPDARVLNKVLQHKTTYVWTCLT